jgi:hypothetical protein
LRCAKHSRDIRGINQTSGQNAVDQVPRQVSVDQASTKDSLRGRGHGISSTWVFGFRQHPLCPPGRSQASISIGVSQSCRPNDGCSSL